jgi:hypothetical protein
MKRASPLLLSLFAFTGSAHAASSDFIGEFLNPGGRGETRMKAEERVYQSQYAAGSTYGLAQTRVEASAPLGGTPESSWRANAFAGYDAITSNAAFPNGRVMPNRLWDPGIGVSNARQLSNGNSVGASLAVNSPAVRPFYALRDTGFTLNAHYRLAQESGNAWIFFLNESNNRGFLNYVPIPGVAYYFHKGTELLGIVGLPFAMISWVPSEIFRVTAFAAVLRAAEAKATLGHRGSSQLYAAASFSTRNYRMNDRTDADERLFFEQALAEAGVIVPVAKSFNAELGGGQSFARRYFVAAKESDRSSSPQIRPDNALFAAARVQVSF